MTYEHCSLCPRKCGVNRLQGQTGYCGMTAELRCARAGLHLWEEPVLTGGAGSGAVFFSGCTLGCVFCQNGQISREGFGKELTAKELRRSMERLIEQGAANINLVTATQFLPHVLEALTPKLPVPVVWNSGGYERVETLKRLEGLVDIYLPDMKYSDPALAARLSHAPDYVETARAAIREMVRQTGPAQVEDGQMTRGVIIRHLLLPGFLDNTLGVLDWVAETFPPGQVLLSLMSQYTPFGKANTMPPLNRKVTEEEAAAALSYLQLLGIRDGFCQELSAAEEEYVPRWDLSGL